MKIDAFASAPWYLDHLRPIWQALPREERGTMFLGPKILHPPRMAGVVRGLPSGPDRPILVVSHGDLLTARRADRRRLALGQHGAGQSYCVAPDTRVLTGDLRWVAAETLGVGDPVVAFDEDRPSARGRRWRRATVTATRRLTRPCYRIELADGTVLVSSAEHRWLKAAKQTCDWLETSRLRDSGLRASHLVKLVEPWAEDRSWGAGYLAAAFDGEGYMTRSDRDASRGPRMMVGYTQKANGMSAEVERQLDLRGFPWRRSDHESGVSTWHVTGGRSQLLRFLGQIRPRRLLAAFEPDDGGRIRSIDNVRIERITYIGEQEVIGLTTSTGTFVAEGFASHNSNDHQSFPGGRDQDDVGLFLVPNATAAERSRAAYPEATVAVVGCPKLEGLPTRGPGPTTVAISFHWDGRTISPEARSAFPYYKAMLLTLGRSFRVIGHAHPRAMRLVEPFYRRAGIEVVGSFEDVLRRADVYVCDNSSSLFEFAATGRNVVVMNHPFMRRNREHGLRFWAAAGVGVQVDAPRGLPAAVARALAGGPDVVAAREAALDLVYQPRRGGAALAAEALVEWAARAVPAPAPAVPARQSSAMPRERGLTPRFAAR